MDPGITAFVTGLPSLTGPDIDRNCLALTIDLVNMGLHRGKIQTAIYETIWSGERVEWIFILIRIIGFPNNVCAFIGYYNLNP